MKSALSALLGVTDRPFQPLRPKLPGKHTEELSLQTTRHSGILLTVGYSFYTYVV